MTDRYILLPRLSLRGSSATHSLFTSLPRVQGGSAPVAARLAMLDSPEVRVVDSFQETGPRLVEADQDTVARLNSPLSPFRAVPEIVYPHPNPPLKALAAGPVAAAQSIVITCISQSAHAPIQGATVVAFTNFASRVGDQGTTDAAGKVTLNLNGPAIERVYVYAPSGYWGAFRRNLPLQSTTIQLTDVNLSYTDCLRHYYPATRFNSSTGVTVGIIDTGVGPHGHLNVIGGRNTVTGEAAVDFADGDHHGTHVAGIVGANGTPPSGLRGMAPGVKLRAYRVFGQGAAGASNYAILKAMIFAADDGCDVINLSLGGGPHDAIVEEAIADARLQGMLVVVAAGNEGRKPVSYPAAYTGAIAVSAMGREGTFPPGSLHEGEVLRPPNGNTQPEFLADFSNVGQQIAVTGLGVGVLSTLPNSGFGPLSGTSMAAPMIAGAAACLLSQNPMIHGMNRDALRSNAIERLLQTNCVKRGFGAVSEGYGLPDPAVV